MLPVAVNVPLDRSYDTAEFSHAFSCWPPVINTLPEGSSVCAAPARSGVSTIACAGPTPKKAQRINGKARRNDFFILEQRGRTKPAAKGERPNLTDQTAKSK